MTTTTTSLATPDSPTSADAIMSMSNAAFEQWLPVQSKAALRSSVYQQRQELQTARLHMNKVVAFSQMLEGIRDQALEYLNDTLVEMLSDILGAERVALYWVGSEELFGIDPVDQETQDPFRCRRINLADSSSASNNSTANSDGDDNSAHDAGCVPSKVYRTGQGVRWLARILPMHAHGRVFALTKTHTDTPTCLMMERGGSEGRGG